MGFLYTLKPVETCMVANYNSLLLRSIYISLSSTEVTAVFSEWGGTASLQATAYIIGAYPQWQYSNAGV